MSKYAIRVENVSKMYKLYDKPTDRFKEAIGLGRKKQLYREHYALNNISFDVKTGECVGIIGTNGSGKSTVLKIITGVLNPTDGNVMVNGRISALLELGAGFNMEYTGIENVYLNGTMIGFTREEIDRKMDDILAFADIGDFVNQPVKTYSSGMFVRLAFAVAINIDPEILIVDEALSVGDVFFQSKCYHKFEEFKKQGKTILFVSHDLSSISKYCDRVILINKGVKLAEGTPKDMVDMYKKVLVNQLDDGGEEEKKTDEEDVKQVLDIQNESVMWKNYFERNPQTLEYGSSLAEIIDYGIFDEKGKLSNTIEKGTECTIAVKIRFNQKIDEPIIAFTFKDIKGIEITGTNTMYEKVENIKADAGDVRQVFFRQKVDLQGGVYLLSLGCTGFQDGEFVVYHRLYDVITLSVISEQNTVGYFDMNSTVTVK
jgi:teichoic acid transport system ATP-binding protein